MREINLGYKLFYENTMEKINAITEQVLYAILESDTKIKTRSICQKFEYRDTLIKSQLQQLRDRRLVKVDKVHEYGGNAKATNYYTSTARASEYRDEYDLSIPRYVLRQDFDEWVEFIDEWTEVYESKMNALETTVKQMNSEDQ